MNNLLKYTWLVNTLYRANERGLTYDEISRRWENEPSGLNDDGLKLPRQTLFRWREGIERQFGLKIDCHKYGEYCYYISNPDALEQGELSRWLLDTYSTANALVESAALKDRILAEEIPSGREFLTDIINAMRENKVIELTHRGFDKDQATKRLVEPYCLKLFLKRWYLLARDRAKNGLRTFGVDRVEKVTITPKKFILPEDFDAKSYFSTFFGIVADESVKVERIILRARGVHLHYLRTLPLHPSQKETYTCDEYSDFELRLRPTYDFCMELLRVGTMLEVIEPQSLRHQMNDWVKGLWEMYKND